MAAADQFEALQDLLDREEYEEALQICQKLLETNADDADVLNCLVFCFLSLGRWTAALEVIRRGDGAGGKKGKAVAEMQFERAYCLYRMNKFGEALEVIASSAGSVSDPDETIRFRHLEAQVRYRMGDYVEAQKIYEKLDDPENAPSISVNLQAAYISGSVPAKALDLAKKGKISDSVSYEIAYNCGCAAIEEGKLDEAEEHLRRAEEICRQEVEREGVESVHIHPELVAIRVQRAYLLQRKGSLDEAAAVYTDILHQRAPGGAEDEVDVTVLAVSRNNLVALRPEGKSLFDSLKRINIASRESLEHKLTTKQGSAIAFNKCLVLLQANKVEECRGALASAIQKYGDQERLTLIAASLAIAEKKQQKGEEVLQNYLSANPKAERILLSLAQLRVNQAMYAAAVTELKKLAPNTIWERGLLPQLVSIQQRAKDDDGAVKSLAAAIECWDTKGGNKADKKASKDALRTAADLCIGLKKWSDATYYLKKIVDDVDKNDLDALCACVTTASFHDVKQAQTFSDRLKLPPALKQLDPVELEATPAVGQYRSKRLQKGTAEPGKTEGGTGPAEGEPAKPKKKKKTRFPKDYNPENPSATAPDPERWLPKWERAAYRKVAKKRKDQMSKGPQGALPSDASLKPTGPSTLNADVEQDSRPRAKGRKRR